MNDTRLDQKVMRTEKTVGSSTDIWRRFTEPDISTYLASTANSKWATNDTYTAQCALLSCYFIKTWSFRENGSSRTDGMLTTIRYLPATGAQFYLHEPLGVLFTSINHPSPGGYYQYPSFHETIEWTKDERPPPRVPVVATWNDVPHRYLCPVSPVPFLKRSCSIHTAKRPNEQHAPRTSLRTSHVCGFELTGMALIRSPLGRAGV